MPLIVKDGAGVNQDLVSTLVGGDHILHKIITKADGTVILVAGAPGVVSVEPAASGGLSQHSILSAASINATVVKASPGQIYGIFVSNTGAAEVYLKIYNKATTPAPASDTGVLIKRLLVPGNTDGAGFQISRPEGLEFDAGISYVLVTGTADTDVAAVAASEIMVNIDYK